MDVEDVMDVALYIYNECFRKKYRSPDEMKLHKLLYFAQRESLSLISNLVASQFSRSNASSNLFAYWFDSTANGSS